jgi:SAM-dependent methyltransferase
MNTNQYRLMYELEDTHWWFLAKRRFIASQLPATNPNWKILDLGCGTGGLSLFLEKWGTVTRIDQSADAIKYLRRRRMQFENQDVNSVTTPDHTYDLVCLFDVLYHKNIKNDVKVLKNAYSMLKKGGILLVTDSAVPWLYSNHDRDYMARERYTLSELNSKVASAGFTVIKKSYIYCLVFPIFFTTRILEMFIHTEDVGKVNGFINAVLLGICTYEARLLRSINFPIGSSVIIKAVK